MSDLKLEDSVKLQLIQRLHNVLEQIEIDTKDAVLGLRSSSSRAVLQDFAALVGLILSGEYSWLSHRPIRRYRFLRKIQRCDPQLFSILEQMIKDMESKGGPKPVQLVT